MKKLLSLIIVVVICVTGMFSSGIFVFGANSTGKVTADVLNVRSGPGTNYSVIGTTYYGNTVTITNTAYDSGGSKWYKIDYSYSGKASTGYVSADYITIINSGGSDSSSENITPDSDFEAYMKKQGFPESYKPMLRQLHAKHPQWIFKAQKTGLDWYDVLDEEMLLGRNLVHLDSLDSWKSMEKGAYDFTGNYWIGQDSYYWVPASKQIVAYYLDPRNFLNDTYIFMFENLSYNPSVHTINGVKAILNDTFMKGNFVTPDTKETMSYAQTFMDAAKKSGVSPYHLASRCRNEQGVNGAPQSLGTVKGYENYFNFFDVNAYATSTMTAAEMGCKYAKTTNPTYLLPWTNQYKSIVGGSIFVGNGYITKGQDTLYLQKFDVIDGGNGLYYHQYMTCVFGQANEAAMLKNAYTSTVINSAMEFKIPVYNNMPNTLYPKPTSSGDNNNLLKSLTINGYTLDQSFDKYNMSYTAYITDDVETVNITARPYSSYAKVSGAGKVTLVEGSNNVKINVTAPSGEVRTYNIVITKKKSNYPSAVTGFKSTSDVNSVTLSWDPVKNVNGYIVYKYDTAQKKFVRLKKTADTKTTYKVNDLAQATEYKFAIKAYRTINGKEYASKTYPSIRVYTYLPTVADFRAKTDINSVKLSWGKVTGAQGYIIYKYDTVGKKYVRLKKTTNTNTSYTENNLSQGTMYQYAVKAYRTVNGKEIVSKTYPRVKAYTYLPEVADFKADGDINTATLTWTKQSGVQGYIIYQYDTEKSKYVRIEVTPTNVNKYTVKNLAEGASHKFAIKAYKMINDKEVVSKTYPLSVTKTALSQVENFKAKADVDNITLEWDKNEYAEGYILYKYNFATNRYSKLVKTEGNVDSYVVTGLDQATKYQYAIRAYTTLDGKDVLSKTYPSVTAYTYLPTVADFRAKTDINSVKLSWDKVTGAQGYIIYKYDTVGKKYVRLKKTTNTDNEYTVTSLTPQKSYDFAVKAYKTVDGKEIVSKTYPKLTAETYIDDVTDFKGEYTANGGIKLSWTKVDNAQGYVIYQYDTTAKKYIRLNKTATNISSYTVAKAVAGKSQNYAIRAYKTLNGKEYLCKKAFYLTIPQS